MSKSLYFSCPLRTVTTSGLMMPSTGAGLFVRNTFIRSSDSFFTARSNSTPPTVRRTSPESFA